MEVVLLVEEREEWKCRDGGGAIGGREIGLGKYVDSGGVYW